MQNTLLCFIITFLITLLVSPCVVKLLKILKGEQSILSYVDKHQSKQGTLTIGGLIFILGTIISFFLFCHGNNRLAFIVLLIFADTVTAEKSDIMPLFSCLFCLLLKFNFILKVFFFGVKCSFTME